MGLFIIVDQATLDPMSFFKRKVKGSIESKDGITELDLGGFDDFISKNPKVVVLFYRSNCSHSIKMDPIFSELDTEMKEAIKFCKVNTPTNIELVRRYSVKGTPTFIVVVNGIEKGRKVGEATKQSLKEEIERWILA